MKSDHAQVRHEKEGKNSADRYLNKKSFSTNGVVLLYNIELRLLSKKLQQLGKSKSSQV